MMKKSWVFRRGDIYLADLGKPEDCRQSGVRPIVVLQNDVGNHFSPTVTLAPLTSKTEKKRSLPTHYLLRRAPGLQRPSMVLAEQLGTFDKSCIIRYLGRVSSLQMRGIDEAVRVQLGYYLPEKHSRKERYRSGKSCETERK